jgi:hypothetical protein
MPIVLPQTATVKQIADALDHAVHEFLVAAKSTNITGKYESEVEAWKLFTLAMRDVEAVAELARIDLVLLPAASVLARAVFEIAVKACWMVQPDDPFQKEVRLLAHHQEEERMQERLANKATHFGANPDPFNKSYRVIRASKRCSRISERSRCIRSMYHFRPSCMEATLLLGYTEEDWASRKNTENSSGQIAGICPCGQPGRLS